MAPRPYSRAYHRFPLFYPVIFGGAPFVGEGILTNLSLMGCSVMSDREVLRGSDVRVSACSQIRCRRCRLTSARSNGFRAMSLGWSFFACLLRRGNV